MHSNAVPFAVLGLAQEDLDLGLWRPEEAPKLRQLFFSLSRFDSLHEEDEDDLLDLDGPDSALFEGELAADFSADMLGFPELPEPPCFGDEVLPCLGLTLAGIVGTCFGLSIGLVPALCCFSAVGLDLPTKVPMVPECAEDGLNLRERLVAGDVGRDVPRLAPGGDSVGLMLTKMGLDRGSVLRGSFSGGPMGLSSRLRLRFFSILLLPSSELEDRFLELLRSLRSSRSLVGPAIDGFISSFKL